MLLKPALTLVELLVVMSLVAALSVSAVFSFSASRQNYALKLSADNLVNQLTRAHIFSRENRDEQSWGIKIIDNRNFALVSRNGVDEAIRYQYSLADPIFFVTIPSYVWFDQVTGETESSVILEIQSPMGKKRQVIVSSFGNIRQQ